MNKSTRISRSTVAIGTAIVAGASTAGSFAQDACLDQRLTASDAQSFLVFGRSIATSEQRAVVGGHQGNLIGQGPGAAYVFEIGEDGTWIETQKLLPSDGEPGDGFGVAAAMDGTRIVIGADLHEGDNAAALGSLYVFEWDGDTWQEEDQIVPTSKTAGVIGRALALRGDLLVVGAANDFTLGFNSGAVYVYRYNGSEWVEEQHITLKDGSNGDFFGESIAIVDDETILIGSWGHDGAGNGAGSGSGCNSGAVFEFRYNKRLLAWEQSAMIIPENYICGKRFGEHVVTHDGMLIVNARSAAFGVPDEVHLFEYDVAQDMWHEIQQLVQPIPQSGFGRTVGIGANHAFVGNSNFQYFGDPKGAVFVYEPDERGVWQSTAILRPEPNPWSSSFALYSIAATGDQVFVDATGEDGQAGAVYVYDLNPTPGDLNCDGIVNGDDLAHFLGEWGPCDVCEHCPADVNDDCTVDGADLAILLGNWS